MSLQLTCACGTKRRNHRVHTTSPRARMHDRVFRTGTRERNPYAMLYFRKQKSSKKLRTRQRHQAMANADQDSRKNRSKSLESVVTCYPISSPVNDACTLPPFVHDALMACLCCAYVALTQLLRPATPLTARSYRVLVLNSDQHEKRTCEEIHQTLKSLAYK
jgi:hypothetical protein